ncbi:MAG: hypothetical protein ACRBFS_01765 [Aureispira sp.]
MGVHVFDDTLGESNYTFTHFTTLLVVGGLIMVICSALSKG